MKLISNRALREFSAIHPAADQPLQDWRRIIEKNAFEHFSALKQAFNSVDKVGELMVFNIGGNKYRLVTDVQFPRQLVYVKAVLTYTQYDKGDWKA